MLKAMLGEPGIGISWSTMIPAHFAKMLNERRRSGQLGDYVPSPTSLGNAPMITVADLQNKNADIPSHWSPLGAVAPILPEGHGTFLINLSLPSRHVAAQVCVKGVNVRDGKPYSVSLSDKPRQSYFLGDQTIKGYVLPTSDGYRQFAVLSGKQTVADVATYKGITHTDPHADAIMAAIYYPFQLQRLISIVNVTPYYEMGAKGLEGSLGLRSMSAPALESMSASVMVGAGGYVSGDSPDDPTVSADMFPSSPTLILPIYIVPVAIYNELAEAVQMPKVEQKKLKDVERQQSDFERELAQYLTIGIHTGTEVDELPDVPYDESMEAVVKAPVFAPQAKIIRHPDSLSLE